MKWHGFVLLLCASLAQTAVAHADTARSADAFVDSIGVNTHLSYLDTAYGATDSVIIPRIQELGIRHLRDKMQNADPALEAVQKRLAQQGVRFMLITQVDMTAEAIGGWLKGLGPSAVSAVEGPNEYDLSGDPTWAVTLKQHASMLHQLIKSDPELQGIPVAGPTLVDWKVDSYPALGDQSAFMDLGNFHWYYAGWPPTATGAEHKKLEVIINRYKPVTGDKPFIISECGYHNATVYPPLHFFAPEDVVAKYMLHMFLHHFDYGLVRSFSYELIDEFEDPTHHEANFGLLRSTGEPKPAFLALKNLLALLTDPGPAFVPEELSYSLTGETQDVHRVLLQKRNGDFYLALWLSKPIWQPVEETPPTPAAQTVDLRISTPFTSIQVARPNRDAGWQDVPSTDGTLSLEVDSELQLFKIAPEQTGLTPDPSTPPAGGSGGTNAAGSTGGGTAPAGPSAGGTSDAPAGGGTGTNPPSSAPDVAPGAEPPGGDSAGCVCGVAKPDTLSLSLLLGLLVLASARRRGIRAAPRH